MDFYAKVLVFVPLTALSVALTLVLLLVIKLALQDLMEHRLHSRAER